MRFMLTTFIYITCIIILNAANADASSHYLYRSFIADGGLCDTFYGNFMNIPFDLMNVIGK